LKTIAKTKAVSYQIISTATIIFNGLSINLIDCFFAIS